MIVVRFTIKAKQGCTGKVVEWLKSLPEMGHPRSPHGERVYYPGPFSEWNVVLHEMTFENLQEYEAYFEKVYALPQLGERVDKLREITESGGSSEAWNMEVLE